MSLGIGLVPVIRHQGQYYLLLGRSNTTVHYAPESLATRLVYVIWDPGNTNGHGYQRLQRCCQAAGRLAQAAEFLAQYPYF